MRNGFRGWVALAALFALANEAAAEWRCDCTTVVANCAASATVGDSFIEVRSNVAQCSRVDYIVDGQPFIALVTDGVDRQNWIARTDSPSVIIESCQVCVDNSGETSESSFGSSLYSEGEPTRLIGVAPEYPAAAAQAGIEGHVDVRFTVSLDGSVVDPEVIAAEPPGVFEQAALAAVSRWRYTRPMDTPQTLTERIEFSLADELLSLAPATGLAGSDAGPQPPPSNSCIREDTRYDFGSAIDISLFNACDEPLIVFHCATGTGTNRNLWVCGNTSEPVGRLEVTRAPNSEYWWLACDLDDAGCRETGTQWVRSMDRQLANVDPRSRTRGRLGRSF